MDTPRGDEMDRIGVAPGQPRRDDDGPDGRPSRGRIAILAASAGAVLRLARFAVGTAAGVALALCLSGSFASAAGPPFPEPAAGQRVYDTAGVF
jgi:hypothetical protein